VPPVEIVYATEPGSPDRRCEDYVVCGPDWIAVFDGATAPPGVDSGCVHDVVWLVRRLASAVSARMPVSDAPLADILSAAIVSVRHAHERTCDLANPDSPSSTVSLCRVSGSVLEYLALADSPIVVRPANGATVVIRDDALDHLPGGRPYTRELVRGTRNRPGGFWVASTMPEAAYHGVSGAVDVTPGTELAVLTDGASRVAEVYGHTWDDLLTIMREDGPRHLIARVRALEERNPPPGKRHDDATAVFARINTPD
jgi:hypothetical protein